MTGEPPARFGAGAKAAAWAVHAFTASGVVLGFLALLAVITGDMPMALLWLGVALFVDGVDGEMARHVRVRDVTPRLDGAVLDFIIDYFTYVIVPAVMIWRFAMVPPGWEIPAAATMLAVSCYSFANREAKTADFYFSGFPALWNVAILYFHILQSDPAVNLAVIAACAVLTFIPVKYIHPFRVRRLRRLTAPLAVIWGGAAVRLLLADPQAGSVAAVAPVTFWIWVAISLYFVAISAWRTAAGAGANR